MTNEKCVFKAGFGELEQELPHSLDMRPPPLPRARGCLAVASHNELEAAKME